MRKRFTLFLEKIKYSPAPFFRTLLSVLLGVMLGYSFYYAYEGEFTAFTANLAVIASLISAWIAFETFHRADLAKRPLIVIDFDLESRFELIQLVVENIGEQPAYNLSFQWRKPIIHTSGEELSMSRNDHSTYHIPILAPKQKHYYIIGKYGKSAKKGFFKTFPIGDLEYEGTISYQLDRGEYLRIEKPFFLSLDQYRATTNYASSKTLAYYQIGENLVQLKNIEGHLKSLSTIFRGKLKSKDYSRKSFVKRIWKALLRQFKY